MGNRNTDIIAWDEDADCDALNLRSWILAAESCQPTKDDTDDELVEEDILDNTPANSVDPFNVWVDDMHYGMNPEEILCHLEDPPNTSRLLSVGPAAA
jgi:hypothetical protein